MSASRNSANNTPGLTYLDGQRILNKKSKSGPSFSSVDILGELIDKPQPESQLERRFPDSGKQISILLSADFVAPDGNGLLQATDKGVDFFRKKRR